MNELLYKKKHASFIVSLCLVYALFSPLNQVMIISINKIVTILFIFTEMIFAFLEGRNREFYITTVFWLCIGGWSVLRGPVMSENLSDMTYIVSSFFLLIITKDEDLNEGIRLFFKRYRQIIMLIVILTYILIAISALFVESYEANGAFCGFMYNSHSMAATSILLTSIVELCEQNNEKKHRVLLSIYTLLIVVGGIVVLNTKARTFLIPESVLLWRYCFRFNIKKTQIVPVALAISVFGGYILKDQILEKFVEVMNNKYAVDSMAAFTNFRSVLWKCDINYFIEESFGYKLFGNGFSFVRELHERRLRARLWSHNDFTYLLLSSGIVGVCVYIKEIASTATKICKKKSHIVYFMMYVLFPMLVNGFYIYTPLIWSFLMFRVSFGGDD